MSALAWPARRTQSLPKDAPWPAVIGGFDALDGVPVEPGSVDLVGHSTPYLWKARYSTDAREMGANTLDQYVADHVRLARANWDLVRPGGWMVSNVGDTRANTGGAGGDVRDKAQRKYRPGKVWRTPGPPTEAHPDGTPRKLVGQQWLQVPARVALAVQDATDWELAGEVVWDKGRLGQSDNSLYHHQRSGRPGLQTEAVHLWWKPGGPKVYDAAYLESVGCRGNVWPISPAPSKPPWAASNDDTKAWPDLLCERLVLALTRPGDLVVDDFAGYGTLPRVALYHGRRALGFDLYAGRVMPYTASLLDEIGAA